MSDPSLLAASDFRGPPVSVSEPALPSTVICSAGASDDSCSWTWSIDDIRVGAMNPVSSYINERSMSAKGRVVVSLGREV